VWDMDRATDMSPDLRCATTDTTTIIRTLARLTDTTGLTGLRAECLLAPARGMAGDALGVGVVGGTAGADAVGTMTAGSEVEGLVDAGLQADAALRVGAGLRTVRLVDSTAVADSMAVLFTVGAVSTAEVAFTVVEAEASTVVAVDTVAVTDNRAD
jgi:hypothetical protein